MSELNRVGVGVLVVLLTPFVLGFAVSNANPCLDHSATAPQISFDISYENSTESLTVVHDSGDQLTADDTYSLVVRTRLAKADEYVDQYVLAGDPADFPVEDGDRWVVEPIRAQDQPLSENDTVRIYWIGHDTIPSYCPNSDPQEVTVGKLVVGT